MGTVWGQIGYTGKVKVANFNISASGSQEEGREMGEAQPVLDAQQGGLTGSPCDDPQQSAFQASLHREVTGVEGSVS